MVVFFTVVVGDLKLLLFVGLGGLLNTCNRLRLAHLLCTPFKGNFVIYMSLCLRQQPCAAIKPTCLATHILFSVMVCTASFLSRKMGGASKTTKLAV